MTEIWEMLEEMIEIWEIKVKMIQEEEGLEIRETKEIRGISEEKKENFK